jgi:hypothetical protein
MPRPACRTLLEGHVPADESKRLLTEQPEFRGGGDGAANAPRLAGHGAGRQDSYQVMAVDDDGNARVLAGY